MNLFTISLMAKQLESHDHSKKKGTLVYNINSRQANFSTPSRAFAGLDVANAQNLLKLDRPTVQCYPHNYKLNIKYEGT